MGLFKKKEKVIEEITAVHKCKCGCKKFRVISELHITVTPLTKRAHSPVWMFECYECNTTYDQYGTES